MAKHSAETMNVTPTFANVESTGEYGKHSIEAMFDNPYQGYGKGAYLAAGAPGIELPVVDTPSVTAMETTAAIEAPQKKRGLSARLDKLRTAYANHPYKFRTMAVGVLATAGFALGSTGLANTEPGKYPGTTVVAGGAGHGESATGGQVVPTDSIPGLSAIIPTEQVVGASYPAEVLNIGTELANTGIPSLFGAAGFEGSNKILSDNVVAKMTETGSTNAVAESLGTVGTFEGVKEIALANPDKQYTTELYVSPLADGAIADELDNQLSIVKPLVSLAGINMPDDRSVIPANMTVFYKAVDGDAWSGGLINSAGKFNYKETIAGTAVHYGEPNVVTGSDTTTRVAEGGGTIVQEQVHVDPEASEVIVANGINGMLDGIHNNPQIPQEIRNVIPTTVGDRVELPDFEIDTQNPLSLPNLGLGDAASLPEIPNFNQEIQNFIDSSTFQAPAVLEAAPAAPAAPAPMPIPQPLQELGDAISQFAANSGFQLPTIPGIR